MSAVSDAYIVECVRTAGGRRNCQLSGWHPTDLGAAVVNEVMKRTKLPKDAVDDVIWGCVTPVGAQAANIGRLVSLASGLDLKVPGVTVDSTILFSLFLQTNFDMSVLKVVL